ncbi:uncharacterized protein LOC110732163 [Chenopodium quinoa]|uniref:uncharacterized protein LOC110732163 n=1 Tax=Chenopodium quinoa TaxID=63459 RepID=UPI000B7732B8|nr:uncharacterized protein LOC110732163 [Chenopodium quinoa]
MTILPLKKYNYDFALILLLVICWLSFFSQLKCLGGVLLALDYFLLAGDHFIQGYSIFDLGLSSKFDPQFLSPQVLSLYLRFLSSKVQSDQKLMSGSLDRFARLHSRFLGQFNDSKPGMYSQAIFKGIWKTGKTLFLQLKEENLRGRSF